MLSYLQTDVSTDWLGFDKYGKILYGVRKVSSKTTDHHIPAALEIRKINIFNKKAKTFKKITFDLSNREESKISGISYAMNPKGDLLGVAVYTSLNSYQNSPNVPVHSFVLAEHGINFEFHLINLETGEVKFYEDFRCSQRISLLLQYDEEGCPLFCTDSNQWLMKFNPYGMNNHQYYYKIVLYNNCQSGRFEFMTKSFSAAAYESYQQTLGNETFVDGKMVLIGRNHNYCLQRMHIYDFVTRKWTKIITGRSQDVPRCKHFNVFGTSLNNLFILSIDNGAILKYDSDANLWLKTQLSVKNLYNPNPPEDEYGNKLYYDTSVFAAQDLLNVIITPSRGYTDFFPKIRKNVKLHRLCAISNIMNPLSLKDLSFLSFSKTNPKFFTTDKAMMNHFPNDLFRQYFGPAHTWEEQEVGAERAKTSE